METDKRTLPAGKLPTELLDRILNRYKPKDPRVLIGPRVGTDAAAIDMGDSVIIIKTDPITFPTDDPGWYVVHVNANDIACMGGVPKWLLVTVLLPEHSTTPALVSSIFESLTDACESLGVTLVGGHTEITIGLDRPILVGQMIGETTRDQVIDPASTRPGDAILLCNGIAIEGTAILAHEAGDTLVKQIAPEVLQRAADFLTNPGISVVNAARALTKSGASIRAMHDPTEGGLASALRELGSAVGLNAEIERDKILVYPETSAICAALRLDPMGLIASGALLAVVDLADVEQAIAACDANGIPCAQIGTFTTPGHTIQYRDQEGLTDFPSFEVDEIASYFAQRA